MTRINLMPGAPSAAPMSRVRPKFIPRSRKPLTKRELLSLFDRIQARILTGGEPFGVFAIKHGGGRIFKLISVRHHDYTAQLRVNKALQHMIATYDGGADLAGVWEDLCAFDQESAR